MIEVLVCEAGYSSAQYHEALKLRYKILRDPIGSPYSEDELNKDKTNKHFIAASDGMLVGTISLETIDKKTFQIRSLAVDNTFQGAGVGTKLIEFVQSFAASQSFLFIQADVRCTAQSFYQRMGYKEFSDEFLKLGIAHIKMRKKLS